MTQEKHTPAPWIYANDGFVYDVQGMTICIPHDDDFDPPEIVSNARLMAASPDLLDALKNALRLLKIYAADEGAVGDEARQAITKATGGPTT